MTLNRIFAVLIVAICITAGALTTSEVNAQAKGSPPADSLNLAKNLSYADMSSKATTEVADMKTTLDNTIELVETTRKEDKDVLKLNCINEKLASVKGFLKVSEQSKGKLDNAIKKKDRESAEHQFSLISIAGQKVDNLGVEARSCAGEALRYSGDTIVDKEISGDIAAIDPTNVVDEGNDLFATEEATPFQ